ncbi:hypothetical protein RI367_004766 [Sorochytrium milnesiophthora]
MGFREVSIQQDGASSTVLNKIRVPLPRYARLAATEDVMPPCAGCVSYGTDDIASYATTNHGSLKISVIGQRKIQEISFGRPVWAAVFAVATTEGSDAGAPELDIVALTADQYVVRVRCSLEGRGTHRLAIGSVASSEQRVLLCYAPSANELFTIDQVNAVSMRLLSPDWGDACAIETSALGESLLDSILRRVHASQQRPLDLVTYDTTQGRYLAVLFDNLTLKVYDVDRAIVLFSVSLKQLDYLASIISAISGAGANERTLSWVHSPLTRRYIHVSRERVGVTKLSVYCSCSHGGSAILRFDINDADGVPDYCDAVPVEEANATLALIDFFVSSTAGKHSLTAVWLGPGYYYLRTRRLPDTNQQQSVADEGASVWQRIDVYPESELPAVHLPPDESQTMAAQRYLSVLLNTFSAVAVSRALKTHVEVNSLALAWNADDLAQCTQAALDAYLTDQSRFTRASPSETSIAALKSSSHHDYPVLLEEQPLPTGTAIQIEMSRRLTAMFFDELYTLCLQQHWLANVPLAIAEIHTSASTAGGSSRGVAPSTVLLLKSESISVLRRLHSLETVLADVESACAIADLQDHDGLSEATLMRDAAFARILSTARSKLPLNSAQLFSQIDHQVAEGEGLACAKQLIGDLRLPLHAVKFGGLAENATELIFRICEQITGTLDTKRRRQEKLLQEQQLLLGGATQPASLLQASIKQLLQAYAALLRYSYLVLIAIQANDSSVGHASLAKLVHVTGLYHTILSLQRVFGVFITPTTTLAQKVDAGRQDRYSLKASDVPAKNVASLGSLLFATTPLSHSANSLVITTTAYNTVADVLAMPMLQMNLGLLFNPAYGRSTSSQHESVTPQEADRQALVSFVKRIKRVWRSIPASGEWMADWSLSCLFGYPGQEHEAPTAALPPAGSGHADASGTDADTDGDLEVSPRILHAHAPQLLRILFKALWHIYCRNQVAARLLVEEMCKISDSILERFYMFQLLVEACIDADLPDGVLQYLQAILALGVPQTVLPEAGRHRMFEQLVHYQLVKEDFDGAIGTIRHIQPDDVRKACVGTLLKKIAASPNQRKLVATLDLPAILADFEVELDYRTVCSGADEAENYHSLSALFYTRFGDYATAATHYYHCALRLRRAMNRKNWGDVVVRRTRTLLKTISLLKLLPPQEQFVIVESGADLSYEPSYERAFKKLKLDASGGAALFNPYQGETADFSASQEDNKLVALDEIEMEYYVCRAMHDLEPLFPEQVRFNNGFDLVDAVKLYATAYHDNKGDAAAKRDAEWYWQQASMYTERFKDHMRRLTRGKDFELIANLHAA